MSELFERDWLVRVDTLQVGKAQGLDMSWDTVKTRKKEPNSCSLRIFNLTESQRAQLSALSLKPAASGLQTGRIRVEIEAGYVTTGRTLRFRGDLRTCVHERVGSDWQTTVEGEDGGRAVLFGRISQTFPAGSTYASAMAACARAMGVGTGNLNEVPNARTRTLERGRALHGQAGPLLLELARGLGVTYSIQNGVLQFVSVGRPLQSKAVLLSATTGLVGSPQRDATGLVKARALLMPELVPEGRVQLVGGEFKGLYRIQRAADSCETFGLPWYVDLELKP